MYDFDTIIDRSGTGSLKWDRFREPAGILPMWVADMDFVSAPEIRAALSERVAHGVFGYTLPHSEVEDAVLNYLQRSHSYTAAGEHLIWLPGLVPALNVAARAFGERGDSVLTCTPVYPPFLSAPVWQDRQLITSPLVQVDGQWTFDFDDLEAKVQPHTRTFFLCSPHNPVARVFTTAELRRLGEFCERHDLVLVSDEIHCDLVYPGSSHTLTATLDESIDNRTITLMAPSKTYNMPGLACSYAVIKNPTLRNRFKMAARGMITEVNALGYAGCAAAYNHGEPWRRELLQYLEANRDIVFTTVNESLPGVSMAPMQATYLAWLDVSTLKANGISDPLAHFRSHGVALTPGADFGDDRYLRLNFGCPKAQLNEALARMRKAL